LRAPKKSKGIGSPLFDQNQTDSNINVAAGTVPGKRVPHRRQGRIQR